MGTVGRYSWKRRSSGGICASVRDMSSSMLSAIALSASNETPESNRHMIRRMEPPEHQTEEEEEKKKEYGG
jgi:hypothetical protein